MKICLTTLYDDNFKNFAPYAIQSFKKFCQINSFDLCVYDQLINTKISPSWNKILAILESFKKYDVVFWSDADSIFTGIEENFLKINNFDDKNKLMVASDENGICLSHMLVRNCEYNEKLFNTLLFLKDVKDENFFGDGPKWEQNALKALMLHFNIEIDVMNRRSMKWTTPSMFHKDIFFFHYAVQDNKTRYEIMKTHYEKLYLGK